MCNTGACFVCGWSGFNIWHLYDTMNMTISDPWVQSQESEQRTIKCDLKIINNKGQQKEGKTSLSPSGIRRA